MIYASRSFYFIEILSIPHFNTFFVSVYYAFFAIQQRQHLFRCTFCIALYIKRFLINSAFGNHRNPTPIFCKTDKCRFVHPTYVVWLFFRVSHRMAAVGVNALALCRRAYHPSLRRTLSTINYQSSKFYEKNSQFLRGLSV